MGDSSASEIEVAVLGDVRLGHRTHTVHVTCGYGHCQKYISIMFISDAYVNYAILTYFPQFGSHFLAFDHFHYVIESLVISNKYAIDDVPIQWYSIFHISTK